MGINYRCSDKRKCGKRVTLKQPIDHYVKRPHCPECGKDSLKPTRYDNDCDSKRTCKCSGIGWPHRKGLILNAHMSCEHADTDVIMELGWNDELGVKETNNNPQECPF